MFSEMDYIHHPKLMASLKFYGRFLPIKWGFLHIKSRLLRAIFVIFPYIDLIKFCYLKFGAFLEVFLCFQNRIHMGSKFLIFWQQFLVFQAILEHQAETSKI